MGYEAINVGSEVMVNEYSLGLSENQPIGIVERIVYSKSWDIHPLIFAVRFPDGLLRHFPEEMLTLTPYVGNLSIGGGLCIPKL